MLMGSQVTEDTPSARLQGDPPGKHFHTHKSLTVTHSHSRPAALCRGRTPPRLVPTLRPFACVHRAH